MTEQEAIEIMEEVKSLDDSLYAYDPAYMEALEIAISAIKEIQQYRKIGTVEQMKNQKENLSVAYRIISDYESIGTAEECREAVEKQKLKKPVKDKYHHNCCPNCGWIVSGEGGYGEEFCPHCENCGQAIRWENLEEMENE